MAARSRARRWAKRIGIGVGLVIGVVVVVLLVAALVLHRPRPRGVRTPAADALAHRFEEAVNKQAWDRTKAIRWTAPGGRHHLWDRERDRARVRWSDVTVLLRLGDRSGRAWEAGREAHGERRRELLDDAYAIWINDSYWLNPIVKLFDDGVMRRIVRTEDGRDALLVTYRSGGLTPGDSYLWIPSRASSGLPEAWRMWVSIIPVGGLRVSWEGWRTLSTGARVSTTHSFDPIPVTMHLGDVRGTESIDTLEPGAFTRL